MRKKKPRIARLDQVRISREGEIAIIEYVDPSFMTVRFKIGPSLGQMTDEAVLLLFNQCTVASMRNRDELDPYVAVEIPPGSPQVLASPETENGWVPRGNVLRCVISDGGGEEFMQPIIYVDDQEFSWEDFGKMLCTYAGWGMRIVFVCEDELEVNPKIVVRESKD